MHDRIRDSAGHLQRLGMDVVAHAAVSQAWSVKRELELVCDLARRPPVPQARAAVSMVAYDPVAFAGFDEELERVSGVEYGQALRRALVCRAGIPGLHVAFDEGGSPMYAQWLLDGAARDRLRRRLPGPWRRLGPKERTVEFAYTFVEHRGMGVMAAGMGQLLSVAADCGASRAFTYVRPDNVASLRGCGKVGFVPSCFVSTSFRLGFHRVRSSPIDDELAALWAEATAPRRTSGAAPS